MTQTQSPKSITYRRQGFTLVELMVVIVIIVLLAGLAFMGAKRGVESARIARNLGNIRNLGSLFSSYASEFGHYPPGWDGSYGEGPLNRQGQPMNGRGPDLVNAFMGKWEINDDWLSPMLDGRLMGYEGNGQPTNYSGHPALCYNGGDQGDPLKRSVVRRPTEVFLLCDGIPKSDDDSLNSQTGMRQWYRYRTESNRSRGNRALPVGASEGKDRNGPDFRNKGKCHVLFCDGHTESFGRDDFKIKHVALSF